LQAQNFTEPNEKLTVLNTSDFVSE